MTGLGLQLIEQHFPLNFLNHSLSQIPWQQHLYVGTPGPQPLANVVVMLAKGGLVVSVLRRPLVQHRQHLLLLVAL